MNPLDKIYWMKDDVKLINKYQIYHIDNYIISEVALKPWTGDDQGEYTCVASNALGMNSKSIQLFALPTSSTPSSSATTGKRIGLRRKRPKHPRISLAPIVPSTDNSRVMTISSAGNVLIQLDDGD